MADFTNLLGIRVFISCIGCVGNLYLIFSIFRSHVVKISAVKSFEIFLLGLAVSNLEEILIVNVYDIVIFEDPSTRAGTWSCRLLKFLTISGELSSILFTVVICVFRYQKVRDATERVNLKVYLDNAASAFLISAVCFVLALLLSAPIFVIDVHTRAENSTRTSCRPEFFQCNELHCPTENLIYKYLFIVVCNILPLVTVTIASCLILFVLLRQSKRVEPRMNVRRFGEKSKKSMNLHRSTVAVLAAMALFQVDWSLYVFVQLNFDVDNLTLWNEMKFFISTSYTSLSPYVFGIGNNLFSFKHFRGNCN